MTDTTTNAPEMRHITKVRLENFQSHGDSTIHLEPGINLITGSSDAGKSAILRAINWVLHNKPNGKGFIKHGATEARVTLWFSDGTTVQRIKGDSRNAVMIKKADGTESAYDRFGNDYPAEVLEALGNPPTDDKHGAIDYAEQMAPYFLVSLTPTELPRILAELTRLDDLQDAADNLAKRAREKDKQIKQGQDRIERFEKELEDYGDLDADIQRQEMLDKRAARVDQLARKLKTAKDIVARYKEVMVQGRAETQARDKAVQVAAFAPQATALREQAGGIAAMRSFVEKAAALEAEIETAETALAAAKALSAGEVAATLSGLKAAVARVEKMRGLVADYREISRQGARAVKERDAALASLEALTTERDALRSQIMAAGLWCAACERPLDDMQGGHTHGK